MRLWKTIAIAMSAVWLSVPAAADESNKLTVLTFSKPVQIPGATLQPGRYRFELADPVESRRVVKVANDDGTKQIAMLLTMQNTLREPQKDPVVLFAETSSSEPQAMKAFVYPGETIGYEFIYPHDQAVTIAKRSHTTVLAKSGDKIERINENGDSTPLDH